MEKVDGDRAWTYIARIGLASARRLAGWARGVRVDPEDVAQQAVLRLVAKTITRYPGGVPLRALVDKFVWNEFSSACRAAGRPVDLQAIRPGPRCVAAEDRASDIALDLAGALRRCSAAQATVMTELLGGKSIAETAASLGCSTANVAQVRRRFIERFFPSIFDVESFEKGPSRFFSARRREASGDVGRTP